MNLNLTLLGQSLAMGIFVWFCMKLIWPPILAAMEERRKLIADGLAAGERGQHDMELAQAKAKEVLQEARGSAREVEEQARQRASQIVDQAKTDAVSEAGRIKLAAEAEIEQERARAREELRNQVAGLAIAGAEKLIARRIKD